jgi:hypothetical protein
MVRFEHQQPRAEYLLNVNVLHGLTSLEIDMILVYASGNFARGQSASCYEKGGRGALRRFAVIG